jgi:hypothetical protein
MRVTPRSLVARVHGEERGAVLMIVALLLLALLGMLVLTVDLGRGVAFKRQLVTGADAAALAAAQQCALGNGSGAATAAGDDVLALDVDLGGLGATYVMPGCDDPDAPAEDRFVEVVATADIDYFFAGIFGIDSGDIAARAVAIYGPVPEAFPIPITVDEQQLLDNCGITAGDPPADGVEDCELTYPKDTLQEPRWGVLDLSQWGDEDAAPCSVDANTLAEIIANGGWPDPLPPNNYDCLDNGLSFSVWDSMEGKILTFPVIDFERSTGTFKPNNPPLGGEDCTGEDVDDPTDPAVVAGFDCEIDTAFVIGFIQLLVESVVNSGSTVVVETDYLGITTGGGTPCLPGQNCPADFGIRAVRLVE